MLKKTTMNFSGFILCFALMILGSGSLLGQISGTKEIPADYVTIADFIIDINANGIGSGGVTLNVPSGYTETAPAGGLMITATGTVANPIIIQGIGGAPKPIITASAALTAGALNDAVIKLIGSDYVTISGLELRENAVNTTTAAATNNMTEWGIALAYATVTDGAQNCSIIGNTIVLNRTYQNTFGIYANSMHAITAVTTTASATGANGGSSGLKIYSNDISNVNEGILVVGPSAAADHSNGIDIGGTSPSTGNVITNYGTTGTFSSYAAVSGTVFGILVRNAKSINVSYNTVATSNGGITSGATRGIFLQAGSTTPTGTYTNTINNNSISLRPGAAGIAATGIDVASTSASAANATLNINNNDFNNFGHTVAGTGAIVCIFNANTNLHTTINGNTFTNLSVNTTGNFHFISNDFAIPVAGGTVTVNNNQIVTAFAKTGAGGTVSFYHTTGTPSSVVGSIKTYNNNNFSNVTLSAATILNGWIDLEGAPGPDKNFTNNTFSNITGVSAMTIISNQWSGSVLVQNNTISNITGQGAITAIISSASNGTTGFTQTYNNNTITGLSSTGAGGNVTGINIGATAVPTVSITNNVISGLSSAATSAQIMGIITSCTGNLNVSGNTVFGISASGTTPTFLSGIGVSAGATVNINNNKVYNISASAAMTTSAINGIALQGGTTVNVYNNLVSGLTAPLANNGLAITGILVNSTVTSSVYRVYNNSVYLSATSTGTNFGTAGVYHTVNATATTATLDMRNNIVINESTPNGSGFTAAFRRSGISLANFSSASNRNLLYAGTPSVTRLLMYDGTNSYQTIAAYQTAVAPRETNSFTGEAAFTGSGYGTAGNFFISLTGASSDFLRPVAGITTQAEGGASVITTPAITTDYTGATRSATAPDLGAYEFSGITPTPVIVLNSVTPPASAQCVAAARLVSVNITTSAGTITGATIGYSVNGAPQSNIVMTNVSGTIWEGTIPVPTPANAIITWGVAAANSVGISGTYTGTTYSDEPLTGVTPSATASAVTVCAGSPSDLTAKLTKAGNVQLGTGTTTTSTAGITPFNSNWEGSRTQYLIRASELQALGLQAGNITNMGLIVTASGAGTNPQVNYTIKMAHTANTTLTSAYGTPAGGFTTVFTTPSEPAPAIGIRNYTFSTPFNWDGVSNVLVDICHDNDLTASCASCFSSSSTVQYSVTSFNSVWGSYADNVQSCGVQAGTTISTFNNRPNMIFTGTVSTPITSVTWIDGATTVGTGNPLTVNPTGTTTYTANITASGCVASPAPTVTVTVNPLPSAPTATNSAQCGTQVPTASVTSTTGVPTPTFKWYDAASAGTVLQTGTSNTFTSNVTATTTFYVSELNSVTGCESARTPVTVSVASADGILASVDNATICIGSSIVLTAVNINATPNQTYTYTWTGTAGSGVTSTAGNPITVTPTAAGTYTYTATGVDGSCNAVSTVNVTVDPFTVVLSPVNVTCNGYNNGSFTQGATTCGTAPYTYSVDGSAFTGSIPTNLTPGVHTVIVMNSLGIVSTSQNVTIIEPSLVINAPVGVNASVCQESASALVSASGTTSTPPSVTIVIPFNVLVQPTELSASTVPTVAASPNVISTATLSALPAGSVITSATLNYNGIQATGSSWMSDVRLGLSGAATQPYTTGIGSTNAAGTFNYTAAVTPASINVAGGSVSLHYFDFFNDNTAGSESTFPTGAGVANLTIVYTPPAVATISWWNASTAGTQIGTGSPFETVGTSVLVNTNTPGVYTVYAQGEYTGCSGLTRTPVTITVKAISTSTSSATACNSYTWNGTTYNASGTYTHTLVNSVGCDSIATLNLTINNNTASSVSVSACETYTWPVNGTTYVTSGAHTATIPNAAGCDSVITLNLTINNNTASSVSVSACETYTWPVNGTTYVASGTHTATIPNAAGCDSVITLNLTIGGPNGSLFPVTACGSYVWPQTGLSYTVSGAYNDTVPNMFGCDSVITLSLTINQPTANTVIETACGSYTWAQNGTVYTASGMYTDVVPNAAGCDSVITLNLTIIQPTTATVPATACTSYTWAQNGTTYTTSGMYTATIPNAAGCDSVITLDLTINDVTTSSETVSTCSPSYTWSANGTTYSIGGVYTATLVNAAGCDSVITLNLTFAPFVATATDNGNATITASAGATYQWINCTTNTAISGATAQTFTATANGSYAVVVSNGICSDTSDCVTISNVGIKENTISSISVHPNPTQDVVIVTMDAASALVEVIDVQGKLIQTTQIKSGDQIDLGAYERGVYTLRIKTEFGTSLERIVKN